MEDSELVQHFLETKGRDLTPYNKIVKKYEPIVFATSIKYLRNNEHAEEVTQDVFLKVYQKLHLLKEPKKLKGWILRITSNSCTDHYHKRKRQLELKEKVKVELSSSSSTEINRNQEDEKLEALKQAIETLNDNDKEVIMLHYFSDLKVSEIAKAFECSESAVKMRLVRSRDKILHRIGEKSDQ